MFRKSSPSSILIPSAKIRTRGPRTMSANQTINTFSFSKSSPATSMTANRNAKIKIQPSKALIVDT